jgi:hypothetical protein
MNEVAALELGRLGLADVLELNAPIDDTLMVAGALAAVRGESHEPALDLLRSTCPRPRSGRSASVSCT